MSPMPPGEQPPQGTGGAPDGRARILAVARVAFVARGYAEVSMQKIAAAAGLSKAAIYHHFADKEALFEEVFMDEIVRLHDELADQIELGGTLRIQIERIARYAFASRSGDWNRLVTDANRYGALEQIPGLQDRVNSIYQLVRAIFEQARDTGEIRTEVNLDIVTTLFLSMIGSEMRGALSGAARDASPEARAALATEMILDGIGA